MNDVQEYRMEDFTPRKPEYDYSKPPVDKLPVPLEPRRKKVGALARLWVKLDGNKRNIGLVMQGIGYIATIWTPVGWGAVAIGGVVSGVGLVHDMVKKHETTKEKGGKNIWAILLEFFEQLINYLKGVKK